MPSSELVIRFFQQGDEEGIISLILSIQREEFHLDLTIHDQPDLLQIDSVYCKNGGNFWCASYEQKVVGTIGLIAIDHYGVIRKMFVQQEFRGKEWQTAQRLLNALIEWSNKHQMKQLLLGTIDKMVAAHKFYRRNGFTEIPKAELPSSFPVMPVDNLFFKKPLP